MSEQQMVSDKEAANLRMELRFGENIVIPSDTLERLLDYIDELQKERPMREAISEILSDLEDAVREVTSSADDLRECADSRIDSALDDVRWMLDDVRVELRNLTIELERSRK